MADKDGSFSIVESLLGDRYTREARLAPAFLSVFPIFMLLLASFKGLQSAVPALLALFCVFGVVRWITHIARRFGDQIEMKLFGKWGGKATTTMLRVATGRVEAENIDLGEEVDHLLREAPPADRIMEALKDANGLRFPTVDEDAGAKGDAEKKREKRARDLDAVYEPVVAWMRQNSRGNKLVFEENISYGFQRNFYALKELALVCGGVALAVMIADILGAARWIWLPAPSIPVAIVVAAITIAYILGVLVFVTEESVKVQAFTYARQLLDSVYDRSFARRPARGKGSRKEDMDGAEEDDS